MSKVKRNNYNAGSTSEYEFEYEPRTALARFSFSAEQQHNCMASTWGAGPHLGPLTRIWPDNRLEIVMSLYAFGGLIKWLTRESLSFMALKSLS